MDARRRWVCAVLGAVLAAGMAGCGTPGAPQPPSLNLPDRVTNLAATRAGNMVTLTWTMPKRNTDRLALKGAIKVRVCRKEGSRPCEAARPGGEFAPGAAGQFSESMPPALASGSPRALAYFVELTNRNGRSAGVSNPAIVLAGSAPAPVDGLRVEVRKQGVVLSWQPDSTEAAVRLHRTLLTPPKPAPQAEHGPLAPPREPVEQNFLVEDGSQSGRALDPSVHFGESYEYRAQRVIRATVDNQALDLDGELSAPVRADVLDVFPPSVPTGVAAVATAPGPGAEHIEPSIDLSWQPVTDPDLAGYIVYRREATTEWQRISPAEPVIGPAFHDAHVTPGHTYIYAVSAVDQSGHESARSAETQETVPSN